MGIEQAGQLTANGTLAERVVSLLGRGVAWLTLIMTLLTFGIVVMRYGMNQGWIWLQESVTYLHAMVFMVAAAWAFQTDDHVRVDIFYRDSSKRHKNWVNLAGTLLCLVPFSLFVLIIGWDYVAASWSMTEGSREAGGLPAVWLLKSLILILPSLLLIQSWNTARRCISQIREPQATRRPRLGKSSEASGTRGVRRHCNAVERSRLPPQAGAGKRDSFDVMDS